MLYKYGKPTRDFLGRFYFYFSLVFNSEIFRKQSKGQSIFWWHF